MTEEELEQWQEEFEAFHARFADLFERSESREQARKYLRGLLTEAERKNSWQVAEAVGDRIPDRMQRLLYRVPWDADAARDRLQEFVIETFGDPDGIGVVDETGFRKYGKKSVGVARQYTGTAGKRENSQVATVLSYATESSICRKPGPGIEPGEPRQACRRRWALPPSRSRRWRCWNVPGSRACPCDG